MRFIQHSFILFLPRAFCSLSSVAKAEGIGSDEGLIGPKAEWRSPRSCRVTQFEDVESVKELCIDIILDGIAVPGGTTLDLTNLKKGSTVTFRGITTFGFAKKNVDLVQIGGTDITITSELGAFLNGNGPAFWDGLGSNGGMTKPNRFMTISKVTGNSVIRDLKIVNCPTHCLSISNSKDLTMENILIDNSFGDLPNDRSKGLPAAHNTDGFDISTSTNLVLRNSQVWNQDDCVAVTSGEDILVTNMFCSGGHGLSIGSIGGKSNNTVSGVTFRNSLLVNQENAIRIKSNSGTTGKVTGVTYENIRVANATKFGLIIQQDYLNGGPTGKPTNGVEISNITVTNVFGTTAAKAKDYFILCGKGSCKNFLFQDVEFVGGVTGTCNMKSEGNLDCPAPPKDSSKGGDSGCEGKKPKKPKKPKTPKTPEASVTP